MFGLIRRISGSVIPRPDRPWEEDATSNAPKIGRKRRRSSTDRDADILDDAESSKKKIRGDTPLAQDEASSSSVPQAVDSEGVKEVTKGVKEVELEGKEKEQKTVEEVQPETVPLPEEVAGELDSSSIASTPPPPGQDEGEVQKTIGTDGEAGIKEGQNQSDDDETKVGDVPEATTSIEVSKEASKGPVIAVSTDATAAQEEASDRKD